VQAFVVQVVDALAALAAKIDQVVFFTAHGVTSLREHNRRRAPSGNSAGSALARLDFDIDPQALPGQFAENLLVLFGHFTLGQFLRRIALALAPLLLFAQQRLGFLGMATI